MGKLVVGVLVMGVLGQGLLMLADLASLLLAESTIPEVFHLVAVLLLLPFLPLLLLMGLLMGAFTAPLPLTDGLMVGTSLLIAGGALFLLARGRLVA